MFYLKQILLNYRPSKGSSKLIFLRFNSWNSSVYNFKLDIMFKLKFKMHIKQHKLLMSFIQKNCMYCVYITVNANWFVIFIISFIYCVLYLN